MLNFVPLLALALLVTQIVAFIKFISNGDKNGIVSTLTVWVAGVLVIVLFAQTDFAHSITIGDMPLDTLKFWSQVVVGLTVGASGSGLYNFKKAIDVTDSAKEPPLVG